MGHKNTWKTNNNKKITPALEAGLEEEFISQQLVAENVLMVPRRA